MSPVRAAAAAALAGLAFFFGCGGGDEPGGSGGTDPGEVGASPPLPCDDSAPLPIELACTGLYSDFGAKTVSPTAREFAPASSLWSDGAAKRRWLYLPPGSTIDTSKMDEWVFPVGTKVWKEFTVEGRAIETRLFAKTGPGAGDWIFTTYLWDEHGTRATRIDSGLPNAVGTYEIPSTVHCSQCHHGHDDRLLGVEAISLGLPGATGITLASLAAEGRLSRPPAATSIALPGDEKTQRALAYLHVNCGLPCHNRNASGTAGFTGLLLRLSAEALLGSPPDGGRPDDPTITDTYQTTVDQDFVSAPYVDEERFRLHKRVTRGDPDKSLIVAVVAERGPKQMPPILSHTVDDAGVAILREWVSALR